MAVPSELTPAERSILGAALNSATEWTDVPRRIADAAPTSEGDGLRLIAMAFSYDLVGVENGETRTVVGGPYASAYGLGENADPPAPTSVDSEILSFWDKAANQLDDASATARLRDLRYVAIGPAAHDDGRRAADALAQLAEMESWGVSRVKNLTQVGVFELGC